ncbi:hypothetical protein NDU88_005646, partial [Pleurodeles waltl]
VDGGCVRVGCVGWRVVGEGAGQLVLGDFAPAAVGRWLDAVMFCDFLVGEVDAVVVGPVEFGGVAESD